MSIKRVTFFIASKGGVGKSTTARAFIDNARANSRAVSAWDLDGQTGSLALVYPVGDPFRGVATEDVRDAKAPGAWLDALYSAADDVVLDVPGGAVGDLMRTFAGGARALIAECKEAGREVVVCSVIGIKKDSVASAQQAVEVFGADVHHVVVKNGLWGEQGDFVIYEGVGSDESRRYGRTSEMVRSVGGETVYLPRLSPAADAMADDAGLSYAAAAIGIETLGRRHAANVRYWLDEARDMFAGTWLDVTGAVPTKGRRERVAAA
jgi:hypothetical protein